MVVADVAGGFTGVVVALLLVLVVVVVRPFDCYCC